MQRLSIFLIFVSLLSFSPYAFSQEAPAVQPFRATGLPLPRFVSLKSDKIYVRTGPALRYPIKWVYKRENMPVEITQEFDNWRKIRDFEGEEGWVHQSLLSGERTALIQGSDLVAMREAPEPVARLTARLEPRVVARVDKCIPSWCRLDAGGFEGWVERNSLWGIYPAEEFN